MKSKHYVPSEWREYRGILERNLQSSSSLHEPDPTDKTALKFLDMLDAHQQRIEALEAELNDWRETARISAGETCGDEVHCTCVGPLKMLVRELRGLLAEAAPHVCGMTCASIRRGDIAWPHEDLCQRITKAALAKGAGEDV